MVCRLVSPNLNISLLNPHSFPSNPIPSILSLSSFSHFPLSKIKFLRSASMTKSTKPKLCASKASSSPLTTANERELPSPPFLLFDVMDTLVKDPFYFDMPKFFGLTMQELLQQKHPTAWIDFELGLITEKELENIFFADKREFDYEGLKKCMSGSYLYLDGVEDLLRNLKRNGYEMHAFSNYPVWYLMIEEKLKLSNYMEWTFVSCNLGKRKPDPFLYKHVCTTLAVPPSECIFIDDRLKNVEGAMGVGMKGIKFENASQLQRDLVSLGVKVN